MRDRWMERVLWLGAATGAAIFAAALGRTPNATGAVATLPVPARVPARTSDDALSEAVDVVARGNLFRPERAPGVAEPEGVSLPAFGAPPTSAKPQIVLRGLLGGPPWDALIDGAPGSDGTAVLRVGETIAGLTLRAVRGDTAVITGYDTTWTVTIRRAW